MVVLGTLADEGGFGGDGGNSWTGLLTAPVLIVIVIILLVLVLVVTMAGVLLYRRVRRSPALADAVLRLRAQYRAGPQQDVLQLRLRLREALESGQAAVDAAAGGAGPQGELQLLFRRIQREGVALEAQLRLLESEQDQAALEEVVPAARRRVEDVAGLARRLRGTVAADMAEISDGAIAELRTDVDREVAALQAGVQELRQLNGSGAEATPLHVSARSSKEGGA